ncbi:hypothetical protein A2U01_0083627, partial [Trifolium medium]|nr:hypothetical protein [Trifolium medium]
EGNGRWLRVGKRETEGRWQRVGKGRLQRVEKRAAEVRGKWAG